MKREDFLSVSGAKIAVGTVKYLLFLYIAPSLPLPDLLVSLIFSSVLFLLLPVSLPTSLIVPALGLFHGKGAVAYVFAYALLYLLLLVACSGLRRREEVEVKVDVRGVVLFLINPFLFAVPLVLFLERLLPPGELRSGVYLALLLSTSYLGLRGPLISAVLYAMAVATGQDVARGVQVFIDSFAVRTLKYVLLYGLTLVLLHYFAPRRKSISDRVHLLLENLPILPLLLGMV